MNSIYCHWHATISNYIKHMHVAGFFMTLPILPIFNILPECTRRYRFVSTDDLLKAQTGSLLQVLTMSSVWSSYESRVFAYSTWFCVFLAGLKWVGWHILPCPNFWIKMWWQLTVELVFVMLPGCCQSNLTKLYSQSPQENTLEC